MMTTTYPNHAMQPQMAHPHPMAPGPNPGQPGMGHMQMHPGVSNQGGPVSQAGPMMGMQPGMGPNNHALQHLQPQQAAFLQHQQQQQQQMQMNPQLLQQRNHQAFMRQQQQAQMLQQQQNGMGMGFPTNMTSNMTPQHIAAMQGGMGAPGFANMPNLPPHLRALQQQQQAVHHNQMHQQQQTTSNPHAQALAQAQAAQAQAAHQAQQQHAVQAAHAQSQAAHAQQMQQHTIAMQHAASQSSNHSQSGNQAQGPPTTTQPQQAPLRPPSAIGSHQGQHSPAPPPTPQQPQQQGPPPPQQTPAQNPSQNGPQQPNSQAQNAQMQQRTQAMAQAQAQVQAQAQQQQGPTQVQMQAAARMAMMKQQQQQQQQSAQGQGTLKLLNFVDHLSRMNSAPEPKLDHCKQFVDKFFSETGSFIHAFWLENTDRTKQFEIVYSAIPRYFYTLFTTDVESLQITIDGAIEKVVGSDIRVTCDRAKFIYTYRTPCPMQVVCRGKLTAYWAGSDKLEWLQFETENHQTFIQRAALEQLFTQPSPNQMLTQSPRMNKSSAKQRQNQQRLAQENLQPMLKKNELPAPDVTDMGIPPALQSYLEIYETMNVMSNLMLHYQEHNNLSPAQAMNSWVNQMSSGMPQQQNAGNPMHGGNMPQNMQLLQQSMQQSQPNMPPGARTPQGVGPGGQPAHQFMSPAMQSSLLPNAALNGSPHLMQQGHTPSPSSVPMGVSLSQQGSSATASVNTSPNVSNKRRRSTAKMDNDEGGVAVNGASKTKPSPRIPKRAKGN